jgi:hypothetical protein
MTCSSSSTSSISVSTSSRSSFCLVRPSSSSTISSARLFSREKALMRSWSVRVTGTSVAVSSFSSCGLEIRRFVELVVSV